MTDIVQKLVQSDDLLEANLHLKVINDTLNQRSVNHSAFCKHLSQTITEWSVRGKPDPVLETAHPHYNILKPFSTIPTYLASFGIVTGKVRETRANLKELITDIDTNIVMPSGNFLSKQEEEKVLTALSEKFPVYWQIVSARRKLDIINVNNSHRIYNSTCGTNKSSTAYLIFMFNMKDSTLLPEYVFLHELGHALQVASTGSYLHVPDDFLHFSNTLTNDNLQQGDSLALELFADTFAIAVMRSSYLHNQIPFPFSDDLNKLFESYHTALICNHIKT
jgi:hypothetical protein